MSDLDRKGNELWILPPDANGYGVIAFNGKIVERVRYSDNPSMVTLSTGKILSCAQFGQWVRQLATRLDDATGGVQ